MQIIDKETNQDNFNIQDQKSIQEAKRVSQNTMKILYNDQVSQKSAIRSRLLERKKRVAMQNFDKRNKMNVLMKSEARNATVLLPSNTHAHLFELKNELIGDDAITTLDESSNILDIKKQQTVPDTCSMNTFALNSLIDNLEHNPGHHLDQNLNMIDKSK